MNKLLIIPGNSALRYKPSDPSGFPSLSEQALVPGAATALEFYKDQGFKIVVCENAGSIGRGINTLQEKLSEFIVLITQIAPQIDQFIFCPDFKGAFAYALTKETSNSFPGLRRLRCMRVPGYNGLTAPGDTSNLWEDVDVQPFLVLHSRPLLFGSEPKTRMRLRQLSSKESASNRQRPGGSSIPPSMNARRFPFSPHHRLQYPLQQGGRSCGGLS